MTHFSQKLSGILLASGLLIVVSGCMRVSPNAPEVSASSLGTSQANYTFLNVDTMKAILTVQLGVPATDPLITKLNNNSKTLGKGDASQDLPEDRSFTALKAKLAAEIFIDGCVIGMNDPSVKARIFPKGIDDYEQIFKTFLGRSPYEEETAALRPISSQVSGGSAPAAICAAVLSSIEALAEI